MTIIEDRERLREVIELEVVGRSERMEEGVGGGAGLSATLVSGGLCLVGDACSALPVVSWGRPCWFPSGPGGPFLFPCRPGAFGFARSRLARGFRKDGGAMSL